MFQARDLTKPYTVTPPRRFLDWYPSPRELPPEIRARPKPWLLTLDEAAAWLCTTRPRFAKLVEEGWLPEGVSIDDVRYWPTKTLKEAVQAIPICWLQPFTPKR